MKKKIIKLTESDLSKLVRKIINEVGGYDDTSVMAQHSSNILGKLARMSNELSLIVHGLSNALDKASKDEIREYLIETFGELGLIKKLIDDNIKDFTEDNLYTDSKILINFISKFQKKIDVLIRFSNDIDEEEYFSNIKELLDQFIPVLSKYMSSVQKNLNKFYGRMSSKIDKNIFNTGLGY